jgi:hypothetical protein
MSPSMRQEEIPTECPRCGKPINQNRRYSSDRVQTSCGEDGCRQYVYRINKAKRIDKERQDALTAIRQYCAVHLTPTLTEAILHATDVLMQMDRERGHLQARQIIEAIEWKRCKHDKIFLLEENAVAARRRADKAEEHNRHLEALYKQRIQELEEEVRIYQSLESVIHGIGLRQLEQQPEE